jgi:hypothetical protein
MQAKRFGNRKGIGQVANNPHGRRRLYFDQSRCGKKPFLLRQVGLFEYVEDFIVMATAGKLLDQRFQIGNRNLGPR